MKNKPVKMLWLIIPTLLVGFTAGLASSPVCYYKDPLSQYTPEERARIKRIRESVCFNYPDCPMMDLERYN